MKRGVEISTTIPPHPTEPGGGDKTELQRELLWLLTTLFAKGSTTWQRLRFQVTTGLSTPHRLVTAQ